MQTQTHSLEPFFQHEVTNIFDSKLGLNDPEASAYIARLLSSFAEQGKLFVRQGRGGHTMTDLIDMMKDADPVYGSAPSFDAERSIRKYVGDYSLFVAGMVPEALDTETESTNRAPSLGELIRAGKESYHIVSQFNVFEYKRDASLFARLSEHFERYVLGLALVREAMGKRLTAPE